MLRSANSLGRVVSRTARRQPPQQSRKMGGGAHYMTVSENHTFYGEVFGTICWLWIFHRASHDLPVVLGFRHPWEHGHDDHGHGGGDAAPLAPDARSEVWDKFTAKAMIQAETDDDDDDDDEDDEE